MRTLQPPHWARPKGYANGIEASGRQIFVAGQIGWNAQCQFESDDLVDQVAQALLNVLDVLAQAGAGPQHVARMTWYLTDKKEYLARAAEIGKAYRQLFSSGGAQPHFPAMSAVQVAALIEDRAKVEIECTAVIPTVGAVDGNV
jgi:enamine deaminase RidA (YjgF/YER057c/UK114 family)